MSTVILRACLAIGFLLLNIQVFSQQKPTKTDEPKKSTATSYQSRVPAPERDTTLSLYQSDTRAYLPGNRCLEEYTQKLGFRYVAMPPNQNGSKTDFGMRLHNLKVKTILLFKNGPFWHHRLNKRIKECRQKTGDFVG